MGRDFPKYFDTIETIRTCLADLMATIRKKQYYHPGVEGSYSIKNVLLVLVPELSYTNLKDQDAATQAKQREGLIAYFEMDTLAMVKI